MFIQLCSKTFVSLQFPFKLDIPLVELEVEKEWTKVSDATAKFTIASGFQRSSWDWVGLYKVRKNAIHPPISHNIKRE